MSPQPDSWIKKHAVEAKMIEPFAHELVRDGVISFGVSSYGYDFRLDETFKEPVINAIDPLDPKDMNAYEFKSFQTKKPFHIKPHSILIAQSLEYFKIPRNILGICFGKSTYARSGLLVNITPLEPEWEGRLTFPLINFSSYPIKIYPLEGIAQLIFLESNTVCETSYADRKGKYQNQKEITLSKV